MPLHGVPTVSGSVIPAADGGPGSAPRPLDRGLAQDDVGRDGLAALDEVDRALDVADGRQVVGDEALSSGVLTLDDIRGLLA